MIDILSAIKENIFKIILYTALISLCTLLILFFQKSEYMSSCTAVPASSFASDKSKIFNDNIQSLYSTLGTADDVDMLVGNGQLDTIYLNVTDVQGLINYYQLNKYFVNARLMAAQKLKENSKIFKNEYNQLKIKVWDKNPEMAAELCNELTNQLQKLQTNLVNESNRLTLSSLELANFNELKKLKEVQNNRENVQNNQSIDLHILNYQKIIDEYKLIVAQRPPALYIVEKARASLFPDRPKKLVLFVSVTILSFIFLCAVSIWKQWKIN